MHVAVVVQENIGLAVLYTIIALAGGLDLTAIASVYIFAWPINLARTRSAIVLYLDPLLQRFDMVGLILAVRSVPDPRLVQWLGV